MLGLVLLAHIASSAASIVLPVGAGEDKTALGQEEAASCAGRLGLRSNRPERQCLWPAHLPCTRWRVLGLVLSDARPALDG